MSRRSHPLSIPSGPSGRPPRDAREATEVGPVPTLPEAFNNGSQRRTHRQCRVPPGKSIDLKDYDPAWAGDPELPKADRKRFAEEVLTQDVSALAEAQDRLYAADSLVDPDHPPGDGRRRQGQHDQARHVGREPPGMPGLPASSTPRPRSSTTTSSGDTPDALPERGRIGIFNRSYYEEVLVVRVHPELVQAQRIPDAKVDDDFWADRFADINAFERHLTRNGTVILKFFLHLSKDEQRKRFLKRLKDPTKHWKFSPADLAERGFWDDYMKAYEKAINATSTKWAPWYIIPADHKWVSRRTRRPDRDPGRRVARPPLPRGDRRARAPSSPRPGSSSRRRAASPRIRK